MIYFIDFENVHLSGLAGIETLSSEDTVVILFPYALKSALIKFMSECTTDATIQFYCISVGYKDALDMKLILKAMLMYKTGNSKIAFISKDHIFTGIKDALREFNYLGKLTLAVGSACDKLFRYYCFDYGTLSIFEKVDAIYFNSGHEFVSPPMSTYRLVDQCEMHPEANLKVHGLHTVEERKELWRALEGLEEPKSGKELTGVVLRETKTSEATTDTPAKPVYSLTDNIRRDAAWHEATVSFCFDFLYSIRTECKIYDTKVQTALLSALKRVKASDRSISTMLKMAPGFIGCKEQRLRDCYNAYMKAGVRGAK